METVNLDREYAFMHLDRLMRACDDFWAEETKLLAARPWWRKAWDTLKTLADLDVGPRNCAYCGHITCYLPCYMGETKKTRQAMCPKHMRAAFHTPQTTAFPEYYRIIGELHAHRAMMQHNGWLESKYWDVL